MAKILALSDTHLNYPLSDGNYYPEQLIKLIKQSDLVLHAGDFVAQKAYDNLAEICGRYGRELWAIQGNNPLQKANNTMEKAPEIRDKAGVPLPLKTAKIWNGIKIGLMHEQANNYSYDFSEINVAKNAAEMQSDDQSDDKKFTGVDVLVFGHLHEPIVVWNKNFEGKRRLLVCPGPGSNDALYHKCSPAPTVALLDFDVSNISIASAEIIRISWPWRILALSDTNLKGGKLPKKVEDLAKTVDLVLYVGVEQATYVALKGVCKAKPWLPKDDPEVKNGVRIYLTTNLCKSGVFSEPEVMNIAEDKDIDLLVFGNLNLPIIVWGKKLEQSEKNRLLICPGSSSIAPIYINSFPSVALVDMINGEISSAKSVRIATIKHQYGWRQCKKCQGLFFGPNTGKSSCPAGGLHEEMANSNYSIIANDTNTDGQPRWRLCNKCQGLFFGPNAGKSKCPAGVKEKHDSGTNMDYTLIVDNENAPGQANWCDKCQGLFFSVAEGKMGVCPYGGTKMEPHIKTGSGKYKVEWE